MVERLASYIVQTPLAPGHQLPPERELAQRLGVSRASVRQAIVALEVQGIVEVRHGNGTFLREVDYSREPFAKLGERRRRLDEVLEAREALEVKIADLAARRRTGDDLAAIADALDLMTTEIDRGDVGAQGDAAFHRAVAQAAHNRVLLDLMHDLGEGIEETRIDSLSQPGRPPRSLAGHRAIADAIAAGDSQAAAEAMREHLRLVADVAPLPWRHEQERLEGSPST